MVGLVFCKHTSSRTKKAWLIDHGSWSHKLSKAVPAQHHWQTVPIRKAVKKSSWVLWELSGFSGKHRKKGTWVILNRSGSTEKILFNFPYLCWIIHLIWMDSLPFKSPFLVCHQEQRDTELKRGAAEDSISHRGSLSYNVKKSRFLVWTVLRH